MQFGELEEGRVEKVGKIRTVPGFKCQIGGFESLDGIHHNETFGLRLCCNLKG